ncbi:MAG: helix-turn-helix transcriptional regulator [Halioglobus sp.]|nr:helix-turn-helix transcriptional regulator [Halioglobus sp.]
MNLTGQVAEGTFDLARNAATLTAMFGENWLRSALLTRLEPERLEAMAEAGRFLRDARETAGLSMREFADMLGLSDRTVLEEIESGQTLMPLELMLRSAALLARHDPIPFLIKFMRTYNPALEQTLEQWGVMALPRQFERERRFVNLVRQHDMLRGLSDAEYERFIHYVDSSCQLVLDVMTKEREAVAGKLPAPASRSRRTASSKAGASKTGSRQTGSRKTAATRNKAKPKARAKAKTAPKKTAPAKRSRKTAS